MTRHEMNGRKRNETNQIIQKMAGRNDNLCSREGQRFLLALWHYARGMIEWEKATFLALQFKALLCN
jgi:hypothetical protein